MLSRKNLAILSVLAIVGVIAATMVTTGPASADLAQRARAYAFGASERAVGSKAPEATSEVPPPPDQPRLTQHSDDDTLANPGGLADVLRVRTVACLQPGTSARLQHEMNRAQHLASSQTPTTNIAPPERTEVSVPPAFPNENRCLVPTNPQADFPSGPPSPSPSPGPPSPPAGAPPNCETATAAQLSASGGRCMATLPLWNARAYTRAINVPLASITDLESEAVAMCEDDEALFMTGVRYGQVTDNPVHDLPADLNRPNQNLRTVGGGVVTFWETNWDPATLSTTDGSDTVFVNAMHIITPTEDIIIGHAEATADCPPEPTPTQTPTATATGTTTSPGLIVTPPPGGFPRDVNLEVSKGFVSYGKTLTFSGAVTPASAFATPRRCIDSVRVTIRRDVVGGGEEFQDVGTVRTDTEGNFSFNYDSDRNSNWLAFIQKDEPVDCAESSSTPESVLVRPAMKLKVNSLTPRRGSNMTFRAIVIPCQDSHVGTRVKLRREISGRSVKVAGAKTNADCVATMRYRANFRTAVFDATWPKQDDDHQLGRGRPKVITTRRR